MASLPGAKPVVGPPTVSKYRRLLLPDLTYSNAVEHFARSYFAAMLEFYSGNISDAARASGLDRSTFRRKARLVGAL